MSRAPRKINRRQLLAVSAGVSAAAALAACTSPSTPSAGEQKPAQTAAPAAQTGAKTITWKVQSGWPPTDWHFQNIKGFATKAEEMSGGRLKFELLAPGAVVPTAEMLDAVSKGLLDGCHTNAGLHYGKNVALSLLANAAGGPFGMNAEDFLGWYYIGGGAELYQELLQKEMKLDLVSFATFGETPEPLGWFPKPIKSVDELKGLKFRAAGLAAEVFTEFGMPVASIAPGEIVPALERGTLDASEYSDPTSDMSAGFHEVRKYYHLPGIHQPTGTMEVDFNLKKWNELSKDLQAIIKYAAMAETMEYTVQMLEKNASDLQTLVEKHGVTVVETPTAILQECLKAWDKVAARKSQENSMFAKIYESQKTYARKVVPFRRVAHPPYQLAADYYWKGENPYKIMTP